ncbi:unnamed protein product [Rodentolepis nana]|uniref:Secreted protein n=1 Tax=Rodentolepis nana TaxID=102285 RepID=A0A0R3TUE5_RODNA|nr:unnamed protein product [Rodentolepis nana]
MSESATVHCFSFVRALAVLGSSLFPIEFIADCGYHIDRDELVEGRQLIVVSRLCSSSLISSFAKGVFQSDQQFPQVVQGRPAFFSVSQGVHRASRFLFSSSRCLERPAFFSVPQGV